MTDRHSATILPFRQRDAEGRLPTMGNSEELNEAIGHVTRLRVEVAKARRNGSTVLVSPACDEGCARCVRECAIQRFMLRWWERELASRSAGPALSHAGVVYAEPMGRA